MVDCLRLWKSPQVEKLSGELNIFNVLNSLLQYNAPSFWWEGGFLVHLVFSARRDFAFARRGQDQQGSLQRAAS
ncbi:hypothetical protein CBM2637_A170041 [Cupriavidus taiwanensis]|nr:hypothetical protein CBM2637_A170041 [Cupriavidus taiwanensis]SPA49806.1 protein of unknown function [Cupriavidus taiwanensis]